MFYMLNSLESVKICVTSFPLFALCIGNTFHFPAPGCSCGCSFTLSTTIVPAG